MQSILYTGYHNGWHSNFPIVTSYLQHKSFHTWRTSIFVNKCLF
nr:MAG TPA: hypothetical protein [Crassvirales sp.]